MILKITHASASIYSRYRGWARHGTGRDSPAIFCPGPACPTEQPSILCSKSLSRKLHHKENFDHKHFKVLIFIEYNKIIINLLFKVYHDMPYNKSITEKKELCIWLGLKG